MMAEGVEFRQAVELLQSDYRDLDTICSSEKAYTPKTPAVTKEYSVQEYRLLNLVIDYYHETLKQASRALEYLEKRGIGKEETISHCEGVFSQNG